MKTTLSLLAASTVLAAPIGLPAWSAVQTLGDADARPFAAALDEGPEEAPVILASDDDDDDDRRGGAREPAPAGAVAPPANGLFGTGAPPRVRAN